MGMGQGSAEHRQSLPTKNPTGPPGLRSCLSGSLKNESLVSHLTVGGGGVGGSEGEWQRRFGDLWGSMGYVNEENT